MLWPFDLSKFLTHIEFEKKIKKIEKTAHMGDFIRKEYDTMKVSLKFCKYFLFIAVLREFAWGKVEYDARTLSLKKLFYVDISGLQ